MPTGPGEIIQASAAAWGELFIEVGESQWPTCIVWVVNCGYVEDSGGLPDRAAFKDRYCGF